MAVTNSGGSSNFAGVFWKRDIFQMSFCLTAIKDRIALVGGFLMDIFLGDCDGRALCKQLRATEKYARLPVVLYSAGEITNASARDCGATFFLRKLFEMQALLDKVHQLAPS